MKNFLISGLVDEKYRIKVNLLAISPDHAIKVFQQKYPKAQDIYVIQNLFKNLKFLSKNLFHFISPITLKGVFPVNFRESIFNHKFLDICPF